MRFGNAKLAWCLMLFGLLARCNCAAVSVQASMSSRLATTFAAALTLQQDHDFVRPVATPGAAEELLVTSVPASAASCAAADMSRRYLVRVAPDLVDQSAASIAAADMSRRYLVRVAPDLVDQDFGTFDGHASAAASSFACTFQNKCKTAREGTQEPQSREFGTAASPKTAREGTQEPKSRELRTAASPKDCKGSNTKDSIESHLIISSPSTSTSPIVGLNSGETASQAILASQDCIPMPPPSPIGGLNSGETASQAILASQDCIPEPPRTYLRRRSLFEAPSDYVWHWIECILPILPTQVASKYTKWLQIALKSSEISVSGSPDFSTSFIGTSGTATSTSFGSNFCKSCANFSPSGVIQISWPYLRRKSEGAVLTPTISSRRHWWSHAVRVGEALRPGPIPDNAVFLGRWCTGSSSAASILEPPCLPRGPSCLDSEDDPFAALGEHASQDVGANELNETRPSLKASGHASSRNEDGAADHPVSIALGRSDCARFVRADAFAGQYLGYVFKMGSKGLGYYTDDGSDQWTATNPTDGGARLAYLFHPIGSRLCTSRHRIPISLEQCIPKLRDQGDRRRLPRARTQRKRCSTTDRKATSEWVNVEDPEALKADNGHRRAGLYAFDTLNGNVASTAQTYLESSSADVCFLQELRVRDEALRSAERQAKCAKWSLAIEPAAETEAASTSAGVGVAVRSHLGHSESQMANVPQCAASRVKVTWMGAFCKGGIHLVSLYLWHSEGASCRNIDLLQVVAGVVARLRGPWIIAADWNMCPSVLRGTGFLELVRGCIQATGQATCNDNEYDYFVIDRRLTPAVASVRRIGDAGTSPHSPVRLLLRGRPRSHVIKVLVAPPKARPNLPSGCLEARHSDGWDAILPIQVDGVTVIQYNDAFHRWMRLAEAQIADISGLVGKERKKFCTRSDGPRLITRPALGRPGSKEPKVSRVTLGWRVVAGWLKDITLGFWKDPGSPFNAKAMRARWKLLHHSWPELREGLHDDALRQWVAAITPADLLDSGKVAWLRASVLDIHQQASKYDADKAAAAWSSWLSEGPARSLGRHHRMSRTSTGWIPSKCGVESVSPHVDDNEDCVYEPDDISDEAVRQHNCTPLSSQDEVDLEALTWKAEWKVDAAPPDIPWPKETVGGSIGPITLNVARRAAATFPTDTGLGWDKLHPRAISRCSDAAILALIRILVAAERLSRWPELVGIVIICLLPKPDGGRRPIGLLPSLVRWWMRIRLDVARIWQQRHERPYFYAGTLKGAEVAAWKQAARAELAGTSSMMAYAAALLDLVKAFERVPYSWLVTQASKYEYPMILLRLCIAAYRLPRTIGIDGVYTCLMVATRGIVAGSVTATIELRALLIEFVDDTSRLFPRAVLTVYVDDTGVEAVGPPAAVMRTVVGATQHLTTALTAIGMEWSHTKNVVNASSSTLADQITSALPHLDLNRSKRAKSLGGALGAGRVRNAQVQHSRLVAFVNRRGRFRRLRRAIGAKRTHLVLRTGGVESLVYGQANTGVSNATLLAQRRAVAAVTVDHGAGDLDLTLIMAEGSPNGKIDPAFAAHASPIGKWAEAVWSCWLPIPALRRLVLLAVRRLQNRQSPWAMVKGPAAAFVASAWRLGWTVHSFDDVTTDIGTHLNMYRFSPIEMKEEVDRAVRRWRWRRVEVRVPSLSSARGGFGAFVHPVFKMLQASGTSPEWGPKQQGGLRSTLTNRQWPQSRLWTAQMVATRNCKLCVAHGFCSVDEDDPRYAGTLTHRIWTCPVMQSERGRLVPKWLLREVQGKLRGGYVLPAEDIAFYTRGLLKSPASSLPAHDPEDTFVWHVEPRSDLQGCTWYSDGSRIDGAARYAGLCARHGWASAAFDIHGNVAAAAFGKPPNHVDGIFGAELWGLRVSTRYADPSDCFKIDCMSVQAGAQMGTTWAASPGRRHARTWNSIAQALEPSPKRCIWMPAHCSSPHAGCKELSDGSLLTEADIKANAYVDLLAKEGANADRLCARDRKWVSDTAEKVIAVARWIGQATVLANAWPAPSDGSNNARIVFLRDSDSCPSKAGRSKGARTRSASKLAVPSRPVLVKPRVRHRYRAPWQETPSNQQGAVTTRTRSLAIRTAREREKLADAERVAQWVASRTLVPTSPNGLTAAESFEALRCRVRGKELSAKR